MAKQIEFYFDYLSPYSYLADTQLPTIAKRHGATIVYKPVLLLGLFKAAGNSSPIAVPAKRAYILADLPRWAGKYGVPMKMNPYFPINTIKLMRGAIAAQAQGRFDEYHPIAFRGVWVEELDLGKISVLAEVLKKVGIDPDAIEGDEIKSRLQANTDEAVARGAFGVPAFFVGNEMFWGNDRLDFVEDALR